MVAISCWIESEVCVKRMFLIGRAEEEICIKKILRNYIRRIKNVEIQEIAYWEEINGENKQSI